MSPHLARIRHCTRRWFPRSARRDEWYTAAHPADTPQLADDLDAASVAQPRVRGVVHSPSPISTTATGHVNVALVRGRVEGLTLVPVAAHNGGVGDEQVAAIDGTRER
jgi:hypothetical protein